MQDQRSRLSGLERWPALDGMPQASRRGFLKLAAMLGLTVWLSPEGIGFLGEAEAQEVALRNPELTGRLDPDEARDLWSLFEAIGAAWDNGRFCTIQSQSALRPILDLKTGQAPSYLTEYREAVRILRALKRSLGEEEALRYLLFREQDPHLRRFVVVELLKLQVASGGFRRFGGYENYPGFPGGPFDDPSNPPYRTSAS